MGALGGGPIIQDLVGPLSDTCRTSERSPERSLAEIADLALSRRSDILVAGQEICRVILALQRRDAIVVWTICFLYSLFALIPPILQSIHVDRSLHLRPQG